MRLELYVRYLRTGKTRVVNIPLEKREEFMFRNRDSIKVENQTVFTGHEEITVKR